MSQISNILALIWLDCDVIVDNEGPTFYQKIWGLSMISKWKKKRAVPSDSTWWFMTLISQRKNRAAQPESNRRSLASRPYAFVPRAIVAWLGIDGWTITPAISIALIFFYRVEWGKTPTLNFNGTYLVDYCFLRQFEGMVGDGLFNFLSTYNISQICNVSRYTKFVQNLCKNLAPVLSLQKCSTGAKWVSYSM